MIYFDSKILQKNILCYECIFDIFALNMQIVALTYIENANDCGMGDCNLQVDSDIRFDQFQIKQVWFIDVSIRFELATCDHTLKDSFSRIMN